MYKTRSRNLQRGKEGPRLVSKRRKGGKHRKKGKRRPRVARRGVIVSVIDEQQEVRVSGSKRFLYLNGVAAAKGARPGDIVRIYFDHEVGKLCATLLSQSRLPEQKCQQGTNQSTPGMGDTGSI